MPRIFVTLEKPENLGRVIEGKIEVIYKKGETIDPAALAKELTRKLEELRDDIIQEITNV